MALNHALSPEREFRYIVMWFNEWSEMQREDFVPIMVEYLTEKGNIVDSSSNSSGLNGSQSAYMNGIVNSVANATIGDKPMSLFQCRVKLFREWSVKWPLDFQEKLREKIVELDPKIGEQILHDIVALKNGKSIHNVRENGDDDNSEPIEAPINSSEVNNDQQHSIYRAVVVNAPTVNTNPANVTPTTTTTPTTTSTIIGVQPMNSFTDVLNNEKSVDDYDDNDVDDRKHNHDYETQINENNKTVASNVAQTMNVVEPAEQVIHDAIEPQANDEQAALHSTPNNNNNNTKSNISVEVPLVA